MIRPLVLKKKIKKKCVIQYLDAFGLQRIKIIFSLNFDFVNLLAITNSFANSALKSGTVKNNVTDIHKK